MIGLGVVAVVGGLATVFVLDPQGFRAPDVGPFTYTAPRLAAVPTIDGRLDEAIWQSAPESRAFVVSNGKAHAPRRCVARVGWDDVALYFAFEVEDQDPISDFTQRDQDLWTRDVVEVYLDPGNDGLNYYEFQVSPKGVLFDARFPSYRKDLAGSRRWNGVGVEAGAALVEGGWTAELRVPFAALKRRDPMPPKAGDSWRMNLYRIDMHPVSSGEPHGDYTAWTPPIVGDFHALDRFGALVFGP